MHSAVSAERDAFVDLLVLETGKPLVDCRIEIDRTLLTLETSAEEVARLHGETVPLDLLPSGEGLLGFWVRKPVGVVVGIAGYNYPLLLAAHKIAPALAAGCPMIIKPAPQTPLATLWMVHLLREALLAAGAPGRRRPAGHRRRGRRRRLSRRTGRIGAVSFTGSAAVGHQIARDAAPTKVLLELGSNSALVVAEDADLDAAADAIVRGGYYASGQACISVQRVIAVETIRDALLDKLGARLPGESSSVTRAIALTRVSRRSSTSSRPPASSSGWTSRSLAGATMLAGTPLPATCWVRPCCRRTSRSARLGRGDLRPGVAVRSVPDLDAAFETVNASRYGLHAERLHGLARHRVHARSTGSRSAASSSTRSPASAPTSCRTAASRTPASAARAPASPSRS